MNRTIRQQSAMRSTLANEAYERLRHERRQADAGTIACVCAFVVFVLLILAQVLP